MTALESQRYRDSHRREINARARARYRRKRQRAGKVARTRLSRIADLWISGSEERRQNLESAE